MENIPQEERLARLDAPTTVEQRDDQQTNAFCQQGSSVFGTNARFSDHDRGLVCKKAPIGRALQVLFHEKLRLVVLYAGHNSIKAEHIGTKRT